MVAAMQPVGPAPTTTAGRVHSVGGAGGGGVGGGGGSGEVADARAGRRMGRRAELRGLKGQSGRAAGRRRGAATAGERKAEGEHVGTPWHGVEGRDIPMAAASLASTDGRYRRWTGLSL